MDSFILVFSTFSSEEEAKKISNQVVKARLAACANIVPKVHSIFHWKNELSHEDEVMVLMKTQKKHLKELVLWIQSHHSYELPEVIALPIIGGSEEYLDWIKEETS